MYQTDALNLFIKIFLPKLEYIIIFEDSLLKLKLVACCVSNALYFLKMQQCIMFNK